MRAVSIENVIWDERSDAGEAWGAFYRADTVTWFRPEYATCAYLDRFAQSEWIQRLLYHARVKPDEKTRVLEAGCGIGLYSLALARLSITVQAFDYNAEALARAKNFQTQLGENCVSRTAQFYSDNLLNIQQPDNTFDLVFNQAVLEYFTDPRERARALQEMARVTRPGGCVAVIVQHTGHSLRRYWEWLGWQGYTDQPPVIQWTPKRLKAEMHAAGVTQIHVDGVYPWKMCFWYPNWYKRWRVTNEAVYLIGRALERISLPLFLRQSMALQIMAVGIKPQSAL